MPGETNPLLGIGIGAATNLAGGLLGIGAGKKAAQQQFNNQKQLNIQAHELSKAMWDYTNYENQVKHMENAGLNVGLMYGQGGGGGSTTASTGSGGSAGIAPQYALGLGLDPLSLAQVELIKAQTKKLEVEANKTAGVDTSKAQAEIDLMNSNKIGQDIQNALNNENFDAIVEMTNTNLENAKKQGKTQDITNENLDAQYKADIANKVMDTALKKAQEKLINQQEKESVAKVLQGWEDLKLKNKGLNIEQQKANIQAFASETNRNYPNIMQSAGGVMNRGLKAIYKLFGLDMEENDTKVK